MARPRIIRENVRGGRRDDGGIPARGEVSGGVLARLFLQVRSAAFLEAWRLGSAADLRTGGTLSGGGAARVLYRITWNIG